MIPVSTQPIREGKSSAMLGRDSPDLSSRGSDTRGRDGTWSVRERSDAGSAGGCRVLAEDARGRP